MIFMEFTTKSNTNTIKIEDVNMFLCCYQEDHSRRLSYHITRVKLRIIIKLKKR